MTHPLTEKLIEAIIKAGKPFNYGEETLINESNLRTAIQSVLDGEGGINLNEVEKLVQSVKYYLEDNWDDLTPEEQNQIKDLPFFYTHEQMQDNYCKILRTRIGYDLSQLKEGGV